MGVSLPPDVETAKIESMSKDTSAEGRERFTHEVDDYARAKGPEAIKDLATHMSSDTAQKVLHELELVQSFDGKEINEAAQKGYDYKLRQYTATSSDKYLGTLALTNEAQDKVSGAKHETDTRTDVMYGYPHHP